VRADGGGVKHFVFLCELNKRVGVNPEKKKVPGEGKRGVGGVVVVVVVWCGVVWGEGYMWGIGMGVLCV
jgi:hypothetical protein